jgi:O-antigen ligase
MITGFSVLLLVFFLRGMNAWTTAGWNSFDSSNRLTVWPVIIRDSLQNPWVGNGTGSVRSLTWALAKMDHPHNDFLRVFYDQGGIGLILFLSAWLHRILHHLKGVLHYRRIEESASNYRLHLAGFLAATGIFLSFTTDNTLVYAFVLIPAFVLFAMADSSNMNNRIQ